MRTLRGSPLEESRAAPSKSRGSSASISSGTSTIRASGRATIFTLNTLESYDDGRAWDSDSPLWHVLHPPTSMAMPVTAPESKPQRTATVDRAPLAEAEDVHQPFISASQDIPELTPVPLIVGALLGILFGASSMYLVLKVGLTVSASIPVAVLSITIFRAFTRIFRTRRATILENNITQTAGSAGESIAFGVGVTMPAR